MSLFFFFQAEDGIRDIGVTGVQTCALPILHLFSIEEEQYSPQQERSVEAADALPPAARLSVPDGGATLFPDEVQSEHELALRSEERRVRKECRSRWSPYH